MILITTFGFDEKFQIKSVLNLGKNLEKTIIIAEESETEKSKKALASFINFLDNLSIQHEILRIDPQNIICSISKILHTINSNKGVIVLDLSGGDKIITIETLIALVLSGIDATVEVQDNKYEETKVTFSTSDLIRGDINDDHIKILIEILKGNKNIYKISKATNMSTSSVSRKLQKLIKYGYIKKESNEYSLTTKGLIIAKSKLYNLRT
ncbi:CRISPR locus-related DNA-binding protein [Acidianus sulfidivorans JP7]|uniref:Uncharacterized protein n=1 Tax=Acidianus sulfidivorans JP7 TaxID=619593 RepID=A0A2U9IPA2_9CREN|nr:CRISPR-associated CARF protein Csa3 [Acidianus sulfidivorans]AWR97879.1 CRISPR locus-related DNA-binding protein [Acidianus sulfidivorans JP7]